MKELKCHTFFDDLYITSADPEGGTGGPRHLENHKLYGIL